MDVRGIKTGPGRFPFPIPLTSIPLTSTRVRCLAEVEMVGRSPSPWPSPPGRGNGKWTRSGDSEGAIAAAAGRFFAGENDRTTSLARWLDTRRRILPLLGERAGVRAGVSMKPFMLFQFVPACFPTAPRLLAKVAQGIRPAAWTSGLHLEFQVWAEKNLLQGSIT
jgi:hypothetical protein